MNRSLRALPAVATALVAASCNLLPGSGTAGPSAGPSASTPARTADPFYVDVCGDLAKSNNPLTAGAATDSAPALSTKHSRNRITLPASGSVFAGFVKFSSDKEGDWNILLTRNVPFRLTAADGTPITPSASRSAFPDCNELQAQYTVGLKLGTHYIQLGPTSETEVSIVTENGEE